MGKIVFDLYMIRKAVKNRYLLIANICLGTIIIAVLIDCLILPIFEVATVLQGRELEGLLSCFYSNNSMGMPSNSKLIELASQPVVAISLQKTRNLIMAAILGLFLGVGMALCLEHTRGTIDNSQEAKQYVGLPVLGVIPDFDLANIPSAKSLIGKIQGGFNKITNFLFKK